jgi:hypothetical protein
MGSAGSFVVAAALFGASALVISRAPGRCQGQRTT